MATLPPLPEVSDADWAATPPSVQALVQALVARVAALETEVAALREHLHTHSGNSSRPPSSDPPNVPARGARPASKRRRGGQKGHRRAARPLVPHDRVDVTVPCRPRACGRCGAGLRGRDSAPTRHQVVEVPTQLVHVTEYEVHALTCPGCGATSRGALPAAARGGYGPRFAALVAVLLVRFKASVRDVVAFVTRVLGVPLSAGMVCKLAQRASAALAAPVAAAHAAAQAAPVAHADETGWREAKRRAWAWLLATPALVIVTIAARRSTAVARALLGRFAGVLVSDRWCAYAHVAVARRQLCWAHLAREWQRFVDRGGASAPIGRELRARTRRMFRWWHRLQRGEIDRAGFARRMGPLRTQVEHWLEMGRCTAGGATAATCAEVLTLAPALWTFVARAGVAPTNNDAERQIRLAVLLRKIKYGTDTERGSRFVERMLTTVLTLQRQGRDVVEYVTRALQAYDANSTPPSLLPASA